MREFDLLQHVYAANERLPDSVDVPPGDDMGSVRLGAAGSVLAAVDQLVDGRHVDLARDPLDLVGRKAITRSLSDVAAMAAHPVAALVAVTLPPAFGAARATSLFDAMRATAAVFDAPLIGGDIAVHAGATHPLTCSVTVLATPGPAGPVTRRGARDGDGVYVTGALGRSGDGHHLRFVPRIEAALALAERVAGLHAMIDISDGLGRDAGHLADGAGVTIEIAAADLPLRTGAMWREALADGEDYELLFTAAGSVPETLPAGEGDGVLSVTRIGTVRAGEPAVRVRVGDSWQDGRSSGWEHAGADS